MPFIIEKERDPLYKDGLQKGVKEQKLDIDLIVKVTGLSKKDVVKLANHK